MEPLESHPASSNEGKEPIRMLRRDQIEPLALNSDATRDTPPDTALESHAPALPATGEQATIGKGLVVRGDISGMESLVIEGTVEGSVHLDANRVTVGRSGRAAANITAQEVVVLGKVHGNITALDRIDIRKEGAVIGDVTAARITIEEGAFFKGGIDVRKQGTKPAAPASQPGARSRHAPAAGPTTPARPAKP